ncbi:MAG: DUF3592 domain-containing protein [Candidatus ainarchaeum sp.]|nr:DUF3592 domain-containing protein [Candidatus ainarchaeum sp.]
MILSITKNPIAAIIFGFLFICFGIALAISDLIPLTWDTVDGKVLSSEMRNRTDGMHRVIIDYTYEYDGAAHQDHCCDLWTSDEQYVKSMVESNKAGAEIDVLVNPSSPSESLLKDGIRLFDIHGKSVPAMVVSAVGLLVIASGVISLLRPELRDRDPGEQG